MSTNASTSDFLSPGWWVSVVLVGLVINLLSAYAKPQVDTFLSSISSNVETSRRNEAQSV